MMIVERTKDEIIVRLPADLNIDEIQRFLNYFKYKTLIKNSKASQSDVDSLAKDANQNWWERNKDKFLPETKY